MPGGKRQNGHPEVWAFLTIITFPIVLIATDLLGAEGLWPFGFALLGTFSILVLEAVVRGRLWPFEEGFIDRIGHPDTPLRILIFLGATLLILETTLIFAVSTDRRFDPALIGFITDKECAARQDPISNQLCLWLNQPLMARSATIQKGSLMDYAVRRYAAQAWFPDEALVTCTERNVQRATDSSTGVERVVYLVHCASWKLDGAGELKQKSKNTTFVGSTLQPADDGGYRVVAWTEDPNSEEWKTTLGPIADGSRDRVLGLAILPEFEAALQEEALQRAQTLLQQ